MSEIAKLGPRIGVGRTAEVFGLGDDRVVKLFYPGFPLAHVEAEANASELVAKAGLPAPGFHGLVEIGGRSGIVYERLDGETILQALRRRPQELLRLTRQFAELHRQLHQCEISALRPYRGALAGRIEQAPGLSDADKARVIDYMHRLRADPPMVCHGDFHPDNVMLTHRGPVVIDWMAACAGEPAADVARTLLLLTIGTPVDMDPLARLMMLLFRRLFCHRYQAHYFSGSELTPGRVRSWLPVLAATRLAEGIENETGQLLALAKTGLNR